MKKHLLYYMAQVLLLSLQLFTHHSFLQAQTATVVRGKIIDAQSQEALIGVNISIKDKIIGTVTDQDGNFSLSTQVSPPFTLIFSYVGYARQEMEILQSQSNIEIKLVAEAILGQEIIISASRYEENYLESAVTVEKLDILDIQQSPAPNFYESLRNLKGVDMGTQSLIFTTPNTRGFNGNTNFRVTQIIDGVDNAPPGLNFPAGNIVGISQLDLESVELLVGASSALYGPGGVNGTILMNSKSPFEYPGLSASVQTGLMHVGADYRDTPGGMYDVNVRYAKSFNNKFAFKVNASYISALDWHSRDFRDKTDLKDGNLNRQTNPGYDGVNTYGDEVFFPVNLGEQAQASAEGTLEDQGVFPGDPGYDEALQDIIDLFPTAEEDILISRTGYQEQDLADYDTESLKLSASLHYRINENVEAIFQGSYGRGTSVYTASNRFSLVDFSLLNLKAEIKGPKFFVRAWTVSENGGDTYDIGSTANFINTAWKDDEQWYTDYFTGFTLARLGGRDLVQSYDFARQVADNRDNSGNILSPGQPARLLPGSPEFNEVFNQITSRPITDEFQINGNTVRGSGVVDKSKLHSVEAEYNLSDFFKFADILVGASHKIFVINSEGTIFGDPIGDPHTIHQFGAYVQMAKKFWNDRLKFIGTARYDKNENFEGRVTPRFSLVYSIDQKKQHNIRGSAQTAFRFPSVADQYTFLDVGVFRVIGGLPQFREDLNLEENPVYPLDDPNPLVGQPDLSQGPYVFPRFRPERIVSYEIGYKGLFKNKLLIDTYFYYNSYNGFLASQALGQPLPDGETNFLLTTISTDEDISAYGWAFGADYLFNKGYKLSGNVAYNTLNKVGGDFPSGFLTQFNSPDYRTNLSFSNPHVYKNLGFSLVWRWQNDFLWESTFGVGEIDAYHTLDAQVSYTMKKLKTVLKVGGSNILNNYYNTSFGNPQIGGLYYVSLTFDEFLN